MKGKVFENSKRVKKQQSSSNDVAKSDALREYTSKTPFIRDIADELFSGSKTPAGKTFDQRSKSVISPTAMTAYTPVAKAKSGA